MKHNPRDFKKLNKKAVHAGNVTAKDNFKFRMSNDARIPFGLSALSQKRMYLPNETFCYGRANRP